MRTPTQGVSISSSWSNLSAIYTIGWARFDKVASWILTAAAKTFFRIVFSASEPVISSANVGFVDIVAIVCCQTSSIGFVIPMIFPDRCNLFTWLVPGSLQGHQEWLALRLPVDRVMMMSFICSCRNKK